MADTKTSAETPRGPIQSGDLIKIVRPGTPNLDGSVSGADLAELIRDTIGAALVAGANMTITVNDAGDTITLASSGAGAGPARHPGYKSGKWYRPYRGLTSNTAVGLGALYAHPLIIEQDVTITAFSAHVVTGVGSTHGLVAVYDNDPATCLPGLKKFDVATIDGNVAATSQSLAPAGGNKTLTAGVYWIATLWDGTPTLVCAATADGQISTLLGVENGATNLLGNMSSLYKGVYGYVNGLPADFSTVGALSTANTAPMIGFRAA